MSISNPAGKFKISKKQKEKLLRKIKEINKQNQQINSDDFDRDSSLLDFLDPVRTDQKTVKTRKMGVLEQVYNGFLKQTPSGITKDMIDAKPFKNIKGDVYDRYYINKETLAGLRGKRNPDTKYNKIKPRLLTCNKDFRTCKKSLQKCGKQVAKYQVRLKITPKEAEKVVKEQLKGTGFSLSPIDISNLKKMYGSSIFNEIADKMNINGSSLTNRNKMNNIVNMYGEGFFNDLLDGIGKVAGIVAPFAPLIAAAI